MAETQLVPTSMQRALVDAAAHRTVDFIVDYIRANRERLVELTFERAFGPEGDAYGDATWRLPPPAVLRELDAELADAIFYGSVHQQLPVVREMRRSTGAQ